MEILQDSLCMIKGKTGLFDAEKKCLLVVFYKYHTELCYSS